jgi:hypothetical protein
VCGRRTGEDVVEAGLRHCGYDDLDEAIARVGDGTG